MLANVGSGNCAPLELDQGSEPGPIWTPNLGHLARVPDWGPDWGPDWVQIRDLARIWDPCATHHTGSGPDFGGLAPFFGKMALKRENE